jgi:hypothetical protein
MDIKKYIYQFSVVLFLLASCGCAEVTRSTNNDSNIKKILIDNTSVDKEKDISDLVEEINIVPLKETSGRSYW